MYSRVAESWIGWKNSLLFCWTCSFTLTWSLVRNQFLPGWWILGEIRRRKGFDLEAEERRVSLLTALLVANRIFLARGAQEEVF